MSDILSIPIKEELAIYLWPEQDSSTKRKLLLWAPNPEMIKLSMSHGRVLYVVLHLFLKPFSIHFLTAINSNVHISQEVPMSGPGRLARLDRWQFGVWGPLLHLYLFDILCLAYLFNEFRVEWIKIVSAVLNFPFPKGVRFTYSSRIRSLILM